MKYPNIGSVFEGTRGKKIGIDMDDTFFPFVQGFRDWLANERGIDIEFESFTSYHFKEVLNLELSKARKLVVDYLESDFHWSLKPIPGSKEGLLRLARDNELHMITSRSEAFRDRTLNYIEENIGKGVFRKDFFAYNPYSGEGRNGTKAEICNIEKIGVILDDSAENAASLVESGVRVVMIDWPWNRGFRHELVTRCKGWQ